MILSVDKGENDMEIAKVEYLQNGNSVTVIGRVEITKSNNPRKRVSYLISLKGEYSPILLNEDTRILEKIAVEYSSPVRATKIQMGVHNGGYQVRYINNNLPENMPHVDISKCQIGNNPVIETRYIQTEMQDSREEAIKKFFDRIEDLGINSELFDMIKE